MRLRNLLLLELAWFVAWYTVAALIIDGSLVIRAGDFVLVLPEAVLAWAGWFAVANWLWDHERLYAQRERHNDQRTARYEASRATYRADLQRLLDTEDPQRRP